MPLPRGGVGFGGKTDCDVAKVALDDPLDVLWGVIVFNDNDNDKLYKKFIKSL